MHKPLSLALALLCAPMTGAAYAQSLPAPSFRKFTLPPTDQGSTGDLSGLSVARPGAAANTLANLLGNVVDVASYRLPADGTNWGPAINRARAALGATGGVLRISTPGTLTIATQVNFPKTGPYIRFLCESRATTLVNAASLTAPMFTAGGTTAAGGMQLDIEGCRFTGANKTSSYAFKLTNANGMTFRNVAFGNMATSIDSTDGYALTLDDVTSDGVTSLFYSSTSAHNFVARRLKAYGGGITLKFDGSTDNIVVENSDFEGIATALQTAGGSALRFVGNYVEHMVNDPIYNGFPMYGADISNNWIALGQSGWSMSNFVGGQFKGNSVYNQNIYPAGAGTKDLEVGDNFLSGNAVPISSPYQIPTLLNGWTQQTNYSAVGFRKGRDGRVHLRGNLINTTSALGTATFTLPDGYRPGTARTFVAGNTSSAIVSGSMTSVSIDGTGNVVINKTSGSGTTGAPYEAGLDSISFEPGT